MQEVSAVTFPLSFEHAKKLSTVANCLNRGFMRLKDLWDSRLSFPLNRIDPANREAVLKEIFLKLQNYILHNFVYLNETPLTLPANKTYEHENNTFFSYHFSFLFSESAGNCLKP